MPRTHPAPTATPSPSTRGFRSSSPQEKPLPPLSLATFLSLMLLRRHRRKPDRNFQLQQKSSSCLPGLQSANICRWERREERAFAGSKVTGEAARRPLIWNKAKCHPGEEAERVPEPTASSGAQRRSQCHCSLHPWEKGGAGTAHPRGSLHVLGSCCPEREGPQHRENTWHGDLRVGLLVHTSSPVGLLLVSLNSGCRVTEGGLTCLPDIS